MFTKSIFIITFLLCVCAVNISAQCVETQNDPCVAVHQSILDRAAKTIDELTEARKVIVAFQHERTATDAERAAYKNLVTVSDLAMGILQKGITDRDKVIELQQKAMEAMSQLTEKLMNQLNKPKSAWSKFLSAVKTVVTLSAGVLLGRGIMP